MYYPDFMYVVRKINGEKEFNIIIEAKDEEDKIALRGEEAIKSVVPKYSFRCLPPKGTRSKSRHSLATGG